MQQSFTVDADTGLIGPARQCLSPNRDARPTGQEPRLIVLHGISLPPGQFGGPEIEQLFTNTIDWEAHPYFGEIRSLKVSAHLLVRRDGSVVQFVPFMDRAWHAGESLFRRRYWLRCCERIRRYRRARSRRIPTSRPAEKPTRALLSTGCACMMTSMANSPDRNS